MKEHLDHDKGCGYVKVKCTNRYNILLCMEKMERRNSLSTYNTSACFSNNYACEHCGYTDTYDAIAGKGMTYVPLPSSILSESAEKISNHYDDCASYPLDCPNDCGEGKIKRKDMKGHRDSCELEPLDCPFKYVGCCDKIQRRQMDSHSSNSMQKHLLLLAKAHEKLACKVNELTTK